MNNNHGDSFLFTDIGRAFTDLRQELCSHRPKSEHACQLIDTLRRAINEQNKQYKQNAERASALLSITIAREKMHLGSPNELQKFLGVLEKLVRLIAVY